MIEYNLNNVSIAIVGLGYVGLPLAVEFGKKYKTIGFDINLARIEELVSGHDRTRETSEKELKSSQYLQYESNPKNLNADVYIITVPTPIDSYKKPDLTPLIKASETVGKVLKKGDIIIYESTVYPGCTEEDCVPILEKFSGLKFNEDFYCGYSPERINPGDKLHTVTKIKKVTSGSTPKIANFVNELYLSIIEAGTHLAPSIKVAEAAKVIENCQRDINIAFMNELALIFDKMSIDTLSVLEAAESKWNFLPFRPGLVGGHCIGVDPYYLTYKAESLGYNPQVILSGRRINDNMGKHIASETIKLLIRNNLAIGSLKILVMGVTFKENCPDIRNSKVIDIVQELKTYNALVDVYDPWADKHEVNEEYNLDLLTTLKMSDYVAIILAVAHDNFLETPFLEEIETFKGIIYDVKSILPSNLISYRL